jgi:putative DNA primase/helicase
MPDFNSLSDTYRNNVWPAMLDDLSDDLGVSVESLNRLSVGFYPGKQAWTFPERNEKGDITGILWRFSNGKKFCEPESKRGLIYEFNTRSLQERDRYASGRAKWVRVGDAGVTCPVCGKPDWCLVSDDNPESPSAVLCSRISEKSTAEIPGSGYLHILDSKRNRVQCGQTVLPETDLPIIIVEGASDVAAALDLGFVAIGRPSAEGGLQILSKMPLSGKEIWVIGENDAGAGKAGMEKAFAILSSMSDKICRIMPPEGIKDLREWLRCGLTQKQLIEYAGNLGNQDSSLDPNIFENDTGLLIAEKFLRNSYMLGDIPILRNYKGDWVVWQKNRYDTLRPDILKGELYRYLDGKQFRSEGAKGPEIKPYKPSGQKVRDILDALSAWCPINRDPPVWLDDGPRPNPRDLIAFQNGLLDVPEYTRGNVVLHNPDPNLFSLGVFPYSYDPETTSNIWYDFLAETFDGNEECIRLLQQWFGYQCVPDTTYEKLMLFTGRPRSGKSTVLEAMSAMLGQDQCVSTDFQSLASSFGRAPLVGKLSAILGDAKTPRATEADAALETILRIVGGDAIHINQKYQLGYTAYLTSRFTIAMNDLPGFTDHARALAARMNVLYFPKSCVGHEDFALKGRLKKEAAQGRLINFALQGLKDLRQNKVFVVPESSAETLKQMVEMTSPVMAFAEECCETKPGATVSAAMVYEAWQRWCADTGRKPGIQAQFGRWLMQACPGVSKTRSRIDGELSYVYDDLCLQKWAYKKYLGRP